MNTEQAREKLNSVSKSTATKHPKVLVAELCVVIKFLLDEIDRIKTPTLTVLEQLPENFELNPHKPTGPPSLPETPHIPTPPIPPVKRGFPDIICNQPPWPNKPKNVTHKTLPIDPIILPPQTDAEKRPLQRPNRSSPLMPDHPNRKGNSGDAK